MLSKYSLSESTGGVTTKRLEYYRAAAIIILALINIFEWNVVGLCEDPPAESVNTEDTPANNSLWDNFYGYEPLYFLYGWDPKNIKFQISFKYRVLNPQGFIGKKWPWMADFYFGYTQRSFIDLEAPSDPFLDTSFIPEFLYSQMELRNRPTSILSRLGLEAGIQHESNGKSGNASRNLNILYAKPYLFFGNVDKYHFTFAPKVWIYIGNLSENPDIADFNGYFDLELKFGKPGSFELRSNLRQGAEGGSVQIDFTYPFRILTFGNFNGYFQAQYFSGYGETLLFYDQKDSQFRIGFALYR
jgi:outer membrane phospholipase A